MTAPPRIGGAECFSRTVETVRDGFATPARLDEAAGTLTGCLHRADGSRVDLSVRSGGHVDDLFASADPAHAPRPEGAERRRGRGLYLGHMMSRHYGHFVTETLSTFWALEELDPAGFDYVAFHQFPWKGPLKPYARFCLEVFGIDPDRLVLIDDRPLAFDELVAPERLLRIEHSADPRLRGVHRRIAAAAGPPEPGAPRRLYLSRRGLDPRLLKRTVANEIRLEAVFRAAGFAVLRPETLPFEAQLRLWAGAEAIAGISGTALHNSLFMAEGARVIELEDLRYGGPAPTQALCDLISGTRGRFIPFAGRVIFPPRGVALFDVGHVHARLAEILAEEGLGGAAPRPPRWRAAEARDVADRVLSPMLRHAARRLLGPRRRG